MNPRGFRTGFHVGPHHLCKSHCTLLTWPLVIGKTYTLCIFLMSGKYAKIRLKAYALHHRTCKVFLQGLRGNHGLRTVYLTYKILCLCSSSVTRLQADQSLSRTYFGNTREPFVLTVAGQKFYIIISPKDMSTVYKNTTTMTFDGFIRDLYTTFGMSKEGVRKMWQSDHSKPQGDMGPPNGQQVHLGQGVHRQQLHPGDQLEDFSAKYLEVIERQLLWENIATGPTPEPSKTQKSVDLYDWCAAVLGYAAVQALFGNTLLELEPRLLEYFYIFDSESWKLTFQLPPLLAKRMHTAKDKSRLAYVRYFQLPLEQRQGICYYLRTVEAKQRRAGMSDRDIGIAAQMFFWGSVLKSESFPLS